MMRFTIDIAGERQISEGISRFAEGLSDYRPVWPSIYEEFRTEVREQFATEGEAGGDRWAPLSNRHRDAHGNWVEGGGYADWKAAHFPGKPILERTGDLKKSLTEKDAPHAVFRSEPRALTMGSDLPYALYHQTGVNKGERKMPARMEIQLTKKFKLEAMRTIQEFMVTRATQLGFRTGMTADEVSSVSRAKAKYPGWSPYGAASA